MSGTSNLNNQKFRNSKIQRKYISPIYRCCNIIVLSLQIVFLIPKIDEGYLIIYIENSTLIPGAKKKIKT